MPFHDWSEIEAAIFHDFHHAWIEEIKRALNNGVLPANYYAMAEQHAAGFGPDVLALQATGPDDFDPAGPAATPDGSIALVSDPKTTLVAETDMEFYRRKQNAIVVRHVSGDQVVAMVEVVSPGNKSNRRGMRSFVEKAAELLDRRIHLLIFDLHPPTPRDPNGVHGAIWEEITGQEYAAPVDKPLTLAAYESSLAVRAFVEPVAVGDCIPDMPLFLEPGQHVPVPVEATYMRALAAMPARWRSVLENQT